jgi:hypothetical protein
MSFNKEDSPKKGVYVKKSGQASLRTPSFPGGSLYFTAEIFYGNEKHSHLCNTSLYKGVEFYDSWKILQP